MKMPIFNCILPSWFFRKKCPPWLKDSTRRVLCTCRELLNKALNPKKCMNEKSIKFDFIYEKVILDYHNVLFNLKHCSQKVKLIIKKHANFF